MIGGGGGGVTEPLTLSQRLTLGVAAGGTAASLKTQAHLLFDSDGAGAVYLWAINSNLLRATADTFEATGVVLADGNVFSGGSGDPIGLTLKSFGSNSAGGVGFSFDNHYLWSTAGQLAFRFRHNIDGTPATIVSASHHGRLIFGNPISGGAVTGTATLVAGTVTVSTTAVKTGSKVFLSRNTTGGTLGDLSAPAASITDGTSFVINSSSGTETSTVNWWVIDG